HRRRVAASDAQSGPGCGGNPGWRPLAGRSWPLLCRTPRSHQRSHPAAYGCPCSVRRRMRIAGCELLGSVSGARGKGGDVGDSAPGLELDEVALGPVVGLGGNLVMYVEMV